MSETPGAVIQRTDASLADIAQELRANDRFLLTTHEAPDGDALGSLLAMHHILEQLGKDSVMFLAAKEFPLPVEYQFLPLEEVFHEAPADVVDRVLVFLDCGNIDRMPVDFVKRDGAPLLNIDHHHDNTRFGTVNLVVGDASCTAEIVYDISKQLGAELTPRIAEALYVGLITDTGRFMYENTTPAAHRMAAELIEAGVEVHKTYRRIFEDLPFSRLRLLSKALASVERYEDGAITVGYLTRADYGETGALEADTEGIVDHLRAVEGTAVAVLVRELLGDDRHGLRKVSLRATDGRVDVSRIARGLGGGGHRQAAGFTTDLPPDRLVEHLRAEIAAQL